MRSLCKILIAVLILFFVFGQATFANAVPISQKDLEALNKNDDLLYSERKEPQKVYYVQKNEEKKHYKKEDKKEIKVSNKECEERKLSIKNLANDRIISEATRKISAIYPKDTPNNSYPGYRGPGQLVIYTKDFGKTTETNEFGKEAIVVDGIVIKLTGANSNIPKNGYVVSGHGSAKKWISDNLKIGTKVSIQDRIIKAYTTVDSYRYFAKAKIDAVEDILLSTKSDYDSRDDKFVYYYLKRAKQQYKKSLKDNSDTSLACAKEAISSASLAFRYTLPYIHGELKGTWIRPSEKSVAEVQRTLNRIKDTGINNIFLETYYHGRTIFPSRVMREYGFEEQNPDFANFDVLSVYVREAHKRGIKVHVWFESFYVGNRSPMSNPNSILALKPDWMNRTRQKADYLGYVPHPQEHNGYFLDPANPEVITFLLKLINEIASVYRVDGFNIDYVRYPNISRENLNNQWGYTPYARQEFMQAYEVDPVEIEPKSSLWDSWCDYRREKITSYVRKVSIVLRNRNIMFSTVVFPDYKVSLQTKFQDWTRWAQEGYLDAMTPLILTSDDDLAKSMLEEIRKKAQNCTHIYPGLFAGFIESDPEDLLRQIHIVRKLNLEGVILFDWAHLNDSYLDVLKTSVFKAQTY